MEAVDGVAIIGRKPSAGDIERVVRVELLVVVHWCVNHSEAFLRTASKAASAKVTPGRNRRRQQPARRIAQELTTILVDVVRQWASPHSSSFDYPSETSSVIMMAKPRMTPMVASRRCPFGCASGNQLLRNDEDHRAGRKRQA